MQKGEATQQHKKKKSNNAFRYKGTNVEGNM